MGISDFGEMHRLAAMARPDIWAVSYTHLDVYKRQLYDEYGNVYIVVDMELKGLIREALIKMILGFDIALEIEEE